MSRTKEYLMEMQLERFKKNANAGIPDIEDSEFKGKTTKEQKELILTWFLSRYCDPAEETPYIGSEGGYQYIWGGPYDPNEEIFDRFSGVASEEAIEEAIDELVQNVGSEWAPRNHGFDEDEYYDEDYDVSDLPPGTSYDNLIKRLNELKLLAVSAKELQSEVVIPLAYAAAIGSLEAHLYEIASNSIKDHPSFARNLITNGVLFNDLTIPLKAIYGMYENINKKILGHFQLMVWHRWKDVEEIFKKGMSIKIDLASKLESHTLKRHDITHRDGKSKEGEIVSISVNDVITLIDTIITIATDLDVKIKAEIMKIDEASSKDQF